MRLPLSPDSRRAPPVKAGQKVGWWRAGSAVAYTNNPQTRSPGPGGYKSKSTRQVAPRLSSKVLYTGQREQRLILHLLLFFSL